MLPGCKARRDDETGSSANSASTESVREGRGVGIALSLARGVESGYGSMGFGGGYHYEMRVEVGNPNSTPMRFDAVDMEFTDAMNRQFAGPMFLTGQTIRFKRRSIVTSYRYGNSRPGAALPEPTDDDEPVVTVVGGHQAVSFPSSTAAALRPTRPGESPTVISVTLMLAGKPVTEVYRASLPPLMEIPDEYQARDQDGWFRVILRPASELPPFLDGDR